MSGDVDLSAAVRFVGEGQNPHRKAGLMVRASLAAEASYVHAVVHGGGLISLQYRETPGGETKEVKASLSAVPARLMLSRRGDVFTLLAGRPGEPPQRVHGPSLLPLCIATRERSRVERPRGGGMFPVPPATLAACV